MPSEESAATEDSRRRSLSLALALLIALLAAYPLLAAPGLLNTRGGGDSPFLLQRLQQLVTALSDGHFPVRWMPDANYGYGYPFYNYYAPLSIYIAAFFRLLGFSYVGAIKLAQVSGFLAAAGGMYALVWRWWRRPAPALLAAAAYTLAPFHLVNVYVRGDSLAEFWAMAFYPLVLLAMEGVDGGGKRRAVVWLGLAYAGLTLSHNISALIFSPLLLLYGLLRWPWAGLRPRLPALAGGALLGLALSAWFWLPALAETGLAQTGPITEGYFHYSQHFRGADLVQSELLFNYDVAGGGAFRMGLAQALISGAGLLAAIYGYWRRRSRPLLFAALVFAIGTIMITPLSRPLWDRLPLLPYTQFPWRFLSVQALGGALLVGALGRLPGRGWERWGVTLLLILLLGSGLGDLKTDHLPLSDADVTAARLAEYEWFTGNIGTTVSAEYLPQTVSPRLQTGAVVVLGKEGAVVLGSMGEAVRLIDRTQRQVWQVTAVDAAVVVLPTLAWPGWAAWVDGAEVDIIPADGGGLVSVDMPAGTHQVELRLTRTPARLAAEWLSLLALMAAAALYWAGGRRPARRPLLIGLGGLLLLAAVARLWPAYAPAGPATWDFAQLGYLHREPAGIPFANSSHLSDYVYSTDRVAPGQGWTVTLNWSEPPAGLVVRLDLVTPASTRPAITGRVTPAPLANAGAIVSSDSQAVTFRIPPATPAGLYLPRLRLVDSAGRIIPALTAGGQPRGDLFLAPVRVETGGVNPLTATIPPAANDLDLTPLAVTVDNEQGALHLTLGWWTSAPLTENYQVSLRLTDGSGLRVSQFDTGPGFGFNPSSLWPAGAWQPDRLSLPLPADHAGPLNVSIQLYAPVAGTDGRVVLTRRLGTLAADDGRWAFAANEPVFEAPAGISPLSAAFGDTFILLGYDLDQDAGRLALTLYWQAAGPGREDYAHFVHLVDAGGAVVAQHDAQPQNNTYPTSQWAPGEVVADPARIDLTAVPAGTYSLVAGWYRPVEPYERLALEDGADAVVIGAVVVE